VTKLVTLIVPRPGISVPDFHDHWRHPHGTLAITYRPLRRYVQNHFVSSNLVGDNPTPYEAIGENWFDSTEAIEHMKDDPFVHEVMFFDEARFEDRERTVWFVVDKEEVLPVYPGGEHDEYGAQWTHDNHSLAIKALQLIPPGLGRDWAGDDDAELSRRVRAYRHVRSWSREPDAPYTGVRELWWPTLTAFEQGVRSDLDAWQQLKERPAGSTWVLATSERLV